MLIFIVIFCLMIAIGFGLASAWSDFKGLTINNMYSIAIAGAFIPAFATVAYFAPESAYFAALSSHLLAGGIVFAVTFGMFLLKWMGAGDSKLSSAFALWVGTHGIMSFLFYMTVFGGVLGLLALVIQKAKPFKNAAEGTWIAKLQEGQSAVPYGIAITFGALVAFYQVGYFDSESLMALTGAQQ